jgi:hypothetical protein
LVREGCSLETNIGEVYPEGGSTILRQVLLCFDCAASLIAEVVERGAKVTESTVEL